MTRILLTCDLDEYGWLSTSNSSPPVVVVSNGPEMLLPDWLVTGHVTQRTSSHWLMSLVVVTFGGHGGSWLELVYHRPIMFWSVNQSLTTITIFSYDFHMILSITIVKSSERELKPIWLHLPGSHIFYCCSFSICISCFIISSIFGHSSELSFRSSRWFLKPSLWSFFLHI